ncbi:glutamate-1-semialdehyde 2,1-aminomutase [Desulfothermus okinawensis JCM 13304]
MDLSKKLYNRALEVIPGGVNSPVRACLSVGTKPIFIKKGNGSKIYSVDGEEYIDLVLSWGPLILGHAHPEVVDAAKKAIEKGSSFGAPCELEVIMAEMICDAIPSIEMVRMVNSGTEATMSAIRLARGYTKREKIVKFNGCYHGHVDHLLAKAGSGVATLSIPGTPGVPEEIVKNTLVVEFNDIEALNEIFEKHGEDIACVIVEPVAGNMGVVPPKRGFLEGVREITAKYKSLLIFDEVITGFRFTYGGIQNILNIQPDLTCLGKIIGGGFPVGAFGGKREIMEHLAPQGEVYQAGTLSGNPVAMAAGIATLEVLKHSDYNKLTSYTKKLVDTMRAIFKEKSIPSKINHMGSAFTVFFTELDEITNFKEAATTDVNMFSKFFVHMRDSNIFIAPSNFECLFTSFAHTQEDLEKITEVVQNFSL